MHANGTMESDIHGINKNKLIKLDWKLFWVLMDINCHVLECASVPTTSIVGRTPAHISCPYVFVEDDAGPSQYLVVVISKLEFSTPVVTVAIRDGSNILIHHLMKIVGKMNPALLSSSCDLVCSDV